MADVKISALPSATTPLAGTEVVPLVQGGATKKVAVNDIVTSAAILSALAALDETAVFGGMATFTAKGAGPGEYTLAKSGIVVKNDDGDEILRIWATDPDDNNYNSQNLYIGLGAGAAQPTNNVDAGYTNIGIGTEALTNIGTGYSNVGLGHNALYHVVDGANNIGIGDATGPTADLSNTIAIGALLGTGGGPSASNRSVIGNADTVDTYFGAEGSNSNTHQNRAFIHGNVAPADGDLAAGQMAIWFDSSNGAAKFMVKAKQADGTVKTGSFDVQT